MLCLPAQLTVDDAQVTLDGLLRDMEGETAQTLELDASALDQIDTAALAVLLACRRAAHQAAKTLVVHGAPARLTDLAALYGVQDLLGLAPAADKG
jgi:phospholipid transport system transporter-binding protein